MSKNNATQTNADALTFDEVVNLMFSLWLNGIKTGEMTTVCLLGSPGIGKTSAARELAKKMHAYKARQGATRPVYCEVRDLSSSLPEDLAGMPTIATEGGKRTTVYAPQPWLAGACEEGAYGVLVFDDLPAASNAVQIACRQASLERRIHDAHFAPEVMVIVTGNRRDDKSGATTLPAHFRNSVCILTVVADFRKWETHAYSAGVDQLVTQFLTVRPQHFSRLPADADASGAFATPRTWMKLGKHICVGRETGRMQELAAGLVGSGVALELVAFDALRNKLVDPLLVLQDPVRYLPEPETVLEQPDQRIAMVTGLADAVLTAAKMQKAKGAKKWEGNPYEQYLTALAHITAKMRELVAVSLATYVAHNGPLPELMLASKALAKTDPKVTRLIQDINRCYSS